MQNIGDGQVEIAMIVRESREAGAGHGYAMIGLGSADDLFLARAADCIVVIPDQLDHRVVGFRPRVHKKYLGHGNRRDAQELFGEFDANIGRFMSERVVKGQL